MPKTTALLPPASWSLLWLALALGGGGAACQQELNIDLKVQVVDNHQQAMAGASILVNSHLLGASDPGGQFRASLKALPGAVLQLEVQRKSSTHFYAPYFEKITISPASKALQLKALLYAVPKPEQKTSLLAKAELADIPADETQPPPEPLATSTPDPQEPEKAQAQALESPPAQSAEVLAREALAPLAPIVIAPFLPWEDLPASPLRPLRYQPKPFAFLLIVRSGPKPIAEAEIYQGLAAQAKLEAACKTNARGECRLIFSRKPEQAVSLVIKKAGYVTKTLATRFKEEGQLQVQLVKGHSLDLFALNRSYGHVKGLPHIHILLNEQKLGQTDAFGHFSYPYTGPLDDLVKLSFRSPKHLPETFSADFIAGPQMSLVSFFSSQEPPAPRLSLLPLAFAGQASAWNPERQTAAETKLRSALQNSFFSDGFFKSYPLENLLQALDKLGLSLSSLAREGWTSPLLKSHFDALIQATFIGSGHHSFLELAVIDSQGDTLVAAKDSVSLSSEPRDLENAIKKIYQKLLANFPFEGAVLANDHNSLTINLGSHHAPNLKVGTLFQLLGKQFSSQGEKVSHEHVGLGQVTSLSASTSQAALLWQKPRSLIHRGDTIVLKPGQSLATPGQEPLSLPALQVYAREGTRLAPLAGVHVYLDQQWLGRSDATGLLQFKSLPPPSPQGTLELVKAGYQHLSQEFRPLAPLNLSFEMQRLHHYIHLETQPPGARVYAEGRYLGQTPLRRPVSAQDDSLFLKIEAPPGYRHVAGAVPFAQGLIDLAGPNKILLELDHLSLAMTLWKEQRFKEAATKLEQIKASHSDYVLAQHLLGEIALVHLDQPEQAAQAFARILEHESFRSQQQGRLAAVTLNYAMALLRATEAKTEPAAQLIAYRQGLELLLTAKPLLPQLEAGQQASARLLLDFYQAYGITKLAALEVDTQLASQAVSSWQSYVAKHKSNPSLPANLNGYLQYARTSLDQTKTQLH